MKSSITLRRPALALLLVCTGIAYADTSPSEPKNAPSPRLIPVCAETLYRACGLVDRQGNWAVQPAYSELYANGDIWVAERESHRIDLLDAAGKTISETSLQDIGRFNEGLAAAQDAKGQQYGYIDTKGQFVIPPSYETAGGFSGGLAVVGNTVDGDLKIGVIDRQNHLVVPLGEYEHVDAYAFGLAVVQRGESPVNGGATQLGVIDAHGKLVMPFAERMGLTVVGPGRVLEATSKNHDTIDHYRLLDTQGHELFAVSGDSAVIQDPTEGLSFFADAEGRTGVLDIQSGHVAVTPRKEWSGGLPFSEGRAWVLLSIGDNGNQVHVLIDRNGKELLRRTGNSIGDFHGGIAAVTDDLGRWGLIDHAGKPMSAFEFYSALAPWSWSEQTPRDGDVMQFTEITSLHDSPQRTVWMNAKGASIVSLEPQTCGIQAVHNAKGETIWPANVADTCAAKASSDGSSQAALSDGAKAVLLEAAQRKLQLAKEEDKRNGYEFGPSSGDILIPLGVEWQHGPATIKLDGPATFDLPKGYRYLSPEAVRKLPNDPSPDASLSVALVAPEDGSWIARMVVAQQGYVPTEGVQLDTQRLEQTINYYGARFDIHAPVGSAHMTSMKWLAKPAWDAAHHRLDWGYRYTDMGSPNGGYHYDSHAELNNVTLGRLYAVALQITLSGFDQDQKQAVIGNPLNTLAQGIHFDQGARYEDHQTADATAALGLEGFITGPKPEETKASEDLIIQGMARAEEKRDLHILGLLGRLAILIVPVLTAWGVRRARKASGSSEPTNNG
ncbi:hypothetical protein DyAD56_08010 [Dyella sp. AD56]|uniref:DUF2167 domain-containing protein n=1 Tax=Dyella sp. AD56 TaxID=1528744 RepID=UPI000C85D987|nr:DUF2167 domain-containing protein [Dyella sp. AD56]PMQ05725.1 hypothetical protein DyAD56_08010 [Dyella sp. AD56]